MTQSGHQACLNDPHVNRYDPPVQNAAEAARASEGCDTMRLSGLARASEVMSAYKWQLLAFLCSPSKHYRDENPMFKTRYECQFAASTTF